MGLEVPAAGWLFESAGAMLLLASASPARRRLLEQAAIAHRVQVSGVDEDAIVAADPQALVRLLAQAKAQAVFATLEPAEPTLVLGCDSLLTFEGEVFGKPADPQEAIHRWQRMAGGWGELHTGHCLLAPSAIAAGSLDPRAGAIRLETVTTRVQLRPSAAARLKPMWPPVNPCNAQAALPWRASAASWLSGSRVATAM
jgi:septum formation protein